MWVSGAKLADLVFPPLRERWRCVCMDVLSCVRLLGLCGVDHYHEVQLFGLGLGSSFLSA